MRSFVFHLILAGILSGCSVDVIAIQHPKNPTSFLFSFPVRQVKSAILNEFAEYPKRYRHMLIEHIDTDVILSGNFEKIFSDSLNRYDLLLYYSGSIGRSQTYFDADGNALDYYADFHIHLTEIHPNQTRVDIITIDPAVAVGKELLPSLPHFVRNIRYEDVNPTTIEEYEILRKIGRGLGVDESMPPVVYPDTVTIK